MKPITRLAIARFATSAIAALAIASPVAANTVVSLELYLAADTSGSVDGTDFTLQRAGFAAAFQSAAVKNAISLTGNGIAVKLVDFGDTVVTAVDWTLITNAAEADAFASAVSVAPRGVTGTSDGQSNLMNTALSDMNSNAYDGARRVLDIASEGAQDTEGCTGTLVCAAVQTARSNFLANGGTTINAIWLNDRDFFGLDATDAINAFEYGTTNVIGGPGNFQTFAYDFTYFAAAIEAKILREVTGVPEPASAALVAIGLAGLAAARKRKVSREGVPSTIL